MKIVACIATHDHRPLAQTLDSLSGQVDEILIYDNELEEVNLTDNGKFLGLTKYTEPIYYLTCDDDLIYPKDYVIRMIDHVERYGCIVTCHGRVLTGVRRSYYLGHKVHHCQRTDGYNGRIDVPGTGVMCFRTDYFNPVGLHLAEDKRKSDLVFALAATKAGKEIMHVPHVQGWIKHVEMDLTRTIAEMDSANEQRHIEIANQIYTLKYGISTFEPPKSVPRRVVRRRI